METRYGWFPPHTKASHSPCAPDASCMQHAASSMQHAPCNGHATEMQLPPCTRRQYVDSDVLCRIAPFGQRHAKAKPGGSTCTRLAHGMGGRTRPSSPCRCRMRRRRCPFACAAAFSTNRLRTENHCSRTANRPTGFARALSCLRTQQCPARPTRAQDLAASLPSTAPPHLHGITHTAVCARNSACYVGGHLVTVRVPLCLCVQARACARAHAYLCACVHACACGRVRADE